MGMYITLSIRAAPGEITKNVPPTKMMMLTNPASFQAFTFPSTFRSRNLGTDVTQLHMACRRNNKLEKREKNKEYAKKFQSKVLHFIFHP